MGGNISFKHSENHFTLRICFLLNFLPQLDCKSLRYTQYKYFASERVNIVKVRYYFILSALHGVKIYEFILFCNESVILPP